MEKIFVDTGGWAALLVENDERHKEAVSIFGRLKESRASLYTSDYVIDETLTLIGVRGGHAHSVRAGKAILESSLVKIVTVVPDYFQDTWALYQKYKDKKFSFTDVSSLCIMNTLKIKKLFGFDREFEKVSVELLT
ncbi:MAG: PIN domain-containing protein [Candidatus Omnitrophica bacterium]|nr:PIN domain-containing protein [Candidatus Omnitrophota bacterium]